MGSLTLFLDHVQADPYANPSKARIRLPHSVAQYPAEFLCTPHRVTALADFVHRRLHQVCTTRQFDVKAASSGWAGAKGGDVQVDLPCSQVLERTAVVITPEYIEARFCVGLPASGRSILGKWAAEILVNNTATIVEQALVYSTAYAGDLPKLKEHIESIEDQAALRAELRTRGLVAFVRNGAILPRQSGATSQPLAGGNVVRFQSPASLETEIQLPNRVVRGMALPAASLILCVGAGFHGKSTLLEALSLGCYNYIPGDGREFVTSVDDVVSIRSEDGRRVNSVDLSNFIANLPSGKSPKNFSTDDASGSTSCAASVSEVLEMGASLMCIDEDTTASNWLASSPVMSQLIKKDTIMPLEKRARELIETTGASLFLVCGSSGDFFKSADVVLKMEDYICRDMTVEAKKLAEAVETSVPAALPSKMPRFSVPSPRNLDAKTLAVQGKTFSRGRHLIQQGGERTDESSQLDLQAIPQLVTESQTRALVAAFRALGGGGAITNSLKATIDALMASIEKNGLDVLQSHAEPDGFLARPRNVDVAAAINRMRGAKLEQSQQ